MWIALALAAAVIAVTWWAVLRAARMRREAESREARVLEAIFAARGSGDAVAGIEIDRVLGVPPAKPAVDDAVMRAAALAATIDRPAGAAGPAAAAAQASAAGAPEGVVAVLGPTVAAASKAAGGAPVAVRDLVQAFYEARGFRATSVEAAARPVQSILAHRSDAQRSYAFVPLATSPAAADLAPIIAAARRIGQRRILVATEAAAGQVEPPVGLKLFDRAGIEAQLAAIDAAVAARIRATAEHRGRQRAGVA